MNVIRRGAASLTIFGLVLLIRAAHIGLAPHHDEGAYASQAYFHYLGYTTGLFTVNSLIPPSAGFTGPLELYALLRSWVFSIPAEPLFLLRLIDGIVAAFGGMMMYKYLSLSTGHRLAAFLAAVLVVIGLNHPEFIEAGSRNPIPLATLLLFSSLYLLERDKGASLVLPACCAAMSVLVREPFVPFAVTVAAYVWCRYGFRAAAKFCGIAAAAGAVVFATVAALKGGVGAVGPMIHSYTSTHSANPEVNLNLSGRAVRAINITGHVALLLSFAMPALVAGLCAPVFDRSLRNRAALSIYALGLALTLAPWAEILLKLPYSYHLAQMLIGSSILIAYGFVLICHMVAKAGRATSLGGWSIVAVIALFHLWLLQDYARTMRYTAGWSLYFAPVMVFGDWESSVVNDAYYLKISSLIRQHSRSGDRILSTCSPVYPLARRIPVTRETSDLNYFLARGRDGRSIDELADLFRTHRPPVFVEEHLRGIPQLTRELKAIRGKLEDLYPLQIDVGPGLSPYRSFSATVHIRGSAPIASSD